MSAGVPCVWVVAGHRELQKPGGLPQCYTVMDEAGSRTLLNMGLQPVWSRCHATTTWTATRWRSR